MQSQPGQFASAINQICDEKNIDAATVISAIEAALVAAFRRDYGNAEQEIKAVFDEKTGLTKMYQIFDVVAKVENKDVQMALSDARKHRSGAKAGEKVEIEVTPESYGRIAAQTAKQIIIQRVREAERESIFNLYKDREGELINSQVQRVEPNGVVYLNIERATVTLEPREQIPGEHYYNGQRLKIYIAKVERTTKGPQIVISRTRPEVVLRLLDLEVPEIVEGSVEVMGISREAGVRTKIAVRSTERGVDPVGSCVGQKGIRIQNITSELNDERIDIIEWNEDVVKYLINALAPANIISVELDEKRKLTKVYVTEDQRSLAIGKNGQNVRLASKLVGWEVDIENWEGEVKSDTESGDSGKDEQNDSGAAKEAEKAVGVEEVAKEEVAKEEVTIVEKEKVGEAEKIPAKEEVSAKEVTKDTPAKEAKEKPKKPKKNSKKDKEPAPSSE